MDNELISTPNV